MGPSEQQRRWQERRMAEHELETIAVVGATGLQGGAVARQLLREGWPVRALTRDPDGKRARALVGAGAEVVRTDAADPAALDRSFAGASGVFSVQNHHVSGYDGEVAQGRNVAEAAARAGVRLLVYASAGTGAGGTGVGSWETKVQVTEHVRRLGIPFCALRPMAFMELMSERKFYPAASVWHLMPKLMGEERPVGWISVEDVAVIAAKAFAAPEVFAGTDVALASDVRSIGECREIWREVTGRRPRSFPMPRRLFERFSGTDETTMWRWLRENDIDLDTAPTRGLHPEALTVRSWVAGRTPGAGPSGEPPTG
jgi:uncharacterized protein YbjT (DUF2867 family)